MLNASPGKTMLSPGENLDLAPNLLALCHELMRHKRPAVIIGGDAAKWGLPLEWNHLVQKCVTIVRAHGIPCISGASYFRHMQIEDHGGYHWKKTEEMPNWQ